MLTITSAISRVVLGMSILAAVAGGGCLFFNACFLFIGVIVGWLCFFGWFVWHCDKIEDEVFPHPNLWDIANEGSLLNERWVIRP